MMVSAEENLVTKMHIPDGARPPALKPGAVIHGPETDTDSLLAGFALELRRRGFRVGGIVQRNLRAAPDCTCEMELVDLATDETIPISQQLGKGSTACRVDPAGMAEAAGRLRQALDSRPDLVVVNKFGGLEKTGGGLAQELLWAMAEGLPVLTSVSVRFLDEWLAFCGGHCELLAPQEPALWRWWGPQRLYEDLLLGLADGPVRRIARGAHWLLWQRIKLVVWRTLPGWPGRGTRSRPRWAWRRSMRITIAPTCTARPKTAWRCLPRKTAGWLRSAPFPILPNACLTPW
jgi:nucleoside-triphosphatase THEP1